MYICGVFFRQFFYACQCAVARGDCAAHASCVCETCWKSRAANDFVRASGDAATKNAAAGEVVSCIKFRLMYIYSNI